jgi:hypothetical protein
MSLLKRTVSARTIAANRRNAQKSTGPRTAEGKRQVAKNALKHGFRGTGALLDETLLAPDLEKDYGEYQRLCADLERAWKPTDPMQRLLVGDLTDLYWKRGRANDYQRGIHFRDAMVASLERDAPPRRSVSQPQAASPEHSNGTTPAGPEGDHPSLKPLTPQWTVMIRQDAALDRQIFDKVTLLLRLKGREDAELTRRASAKMWEERSPLSDLSALLGLTNKADKSNQINKPSQTKPITPVKSTEAASETKPLSS